jgi:hypothetical protein
MTWIITMILLLGLKWTFLSAMPMSLVPLEVKAKDNASASLRQLIEFRQVQGYSLWHQALPQEQRF